VVMRAMARRPQDRYATAVEMRDDLQSAFNLIAGVTPPRPANGWLTPVTLPELTPGSDDALARLEREDIDAFERQVRRRRLLGTFLAAPLALGGLALAGWAGPSLLPTGASVEREPNDRPALASPLTSGQTVRGRIGVAHLEGQPDVDYYRVPPGAGPRALTARVGGVPDLDLVLELFDGHGQLMARANAGVAGEEERLGPVALGDGEAFLRVRPFWTAGDPLASGEDPPYALTVDWNRPRPDWELEPNDTPVRATAIDRIGPITGSFSSYEDQDWFRLRVPAGSRLEGRVDGLDGVDLVLLIGDQRTRIDRRGPGEHESFSVTPAADGVLLIGVTLHLPGPVRRLPRLDEPYTLQLKLRPTVAAKRT
jgi:hypothetical protein